MIIVIIIIIITRLKEGLNECKGIKYIRYLFSEDKNQKSDFYKNDKMKNKIVPEIKIKKDPNKYKDIKDIRYLFNDNIHKGIIDIRYLLNEDYYVKYIKSEFNNLSNNLVKAYTKDIRYMVDHINNNEKLEERPINFKNGIKNNGKVTKNIEDAIIFRVFKRCF